MLPLSPPCRHATLPPRLPMLLFRYAAEFRQIAYATPGCQMLSLPLLSRSPLSPIR